jgi:hypothetical protein
MTVPVDERPRVKGWIHKFPEPQCGNDHTDHVAEPDEFSLTLEPPSPWCTRCGHTVMPEFERD